jgi:3',5'-cyclic AMP phosphodiesterase CpdA
VHRRVLICLAVVAAGASAAAAEAAPYTTVEKTIRDCNDDNLLEFAPGEEHAFLSPSFSLAGESARGEQSEDDAGRSCGPDAPGGRFRLPNTASILNFLHLTDHQIYDEESPARLEFLDSTQRFPAFSPFGGAYTPYEAMTTQVTEALVRQARNATSPVTGERLDLAISTGDHAENQHYNETRWFIDILDGTAGARPPGFADKVDPNSGVPVPGCEATPGSVYDGVRGGGKFGYYEPDFSADQEDGDGYSPLREENLAETGRDVTVRDFPGLLEDANEPFEALGLDMPWYSSFGNHDALILGNSPDAYLGPGGAGDPPPAEEHSNVPYQEFATGCVKPSNLPPGLQEQLEDLVAGPQPPPESALREFAEEVQEFFASFIADPAGSDVATQIVPPDKRRCFLAKDEPSTAPPDLPCAGTSYIEEHFKTTGTPLGHGFANRPPQAIENNDGYYSFLPAEGLRFVVLDSVTDECGSQFCAEGSIDDDQFQWLRGEIQAARGAGQYVVVFAHHTLRTTRQLFTARDVDEEPIHYGQRVDKHNPANPQNMSVGDTLEELYCQNTDVVLAQIAGHEHGNRIQRYDCLADEPPQGAPARFWEVATAATKDFPQQARIVEFVDNGGELLMVLTMLDHDGPAYPGARRPNVEGTGDAGEQVLRLASISREIAYNDYQQNRGGRGSRDDRNVIIALDRPWPYPDADGSE